MKSEAATWVLPSPWDSLRLLSARGSPSSISAHRLNSSTDHGADTELPGRRQESHAASGPGSASTVESPHACARAHTRPRETTSSEVLLTSLARRALYFPNLGCGCRMVSRSGCTALTLERDQSRKRRNSNRLQILSLSDFIADEQTAGIQEEIAVSYHREAAFQPRRLV